jgi:GWxTD domain-containing protein
MVSLFLVAGCSAGEGSAQQCFSLLQFTKMISPSFSSYVMRTEAGGKYRVDLYLQMPYRKLRFVRNSASYRSAFAYTIFVRDRNGEIVHTKEIDRAIEVNSYDETVSYRNDLHMERLFLESGSFTVEVISSDNLSGLRYRSAEKIETPTIARATVSSSSFLILNAIAYEGTSMVLRPILPEQMSMVRDSIGIYQELYHLRKGDTVIVRHEYYQTDTAGIVQNKFMYWTPPYRINIPACSGNNMLLSYRSDSAMIAVSDETLYLVQSHPVPPIGNTIIKRTIYRSGTEGRDSSTSSLTVYRRDPGNRSSATTDEIVGAMRYIMRESEIDSLIASSPEEQTKKIDRYWDEKGGRQRRLEFERRIMDANTLFSSCIDGSRTPMGIVYIVCGPPDYVDCRGSYSENWYYTLGERTFVAQFRPGSGATESTYYELVPFSINESFWQYHIDQWRRRK